MDVTVTGPLTVGAVASLVAQLLKTTGWLPKDAAFVRPFVAAICVTVNAALGYWTGSLDLTLLPETFLSYLAAAAAYDQVFKA